jgi:hypothetical protein
LLRVPRWGRLNLESAKVLRSSGLSRLACVLNVLVPLIHLYVPMPPPCCRRCWAWWAAPASACCCCGRRWS